MRILIIDDEECIRDSISMYLSDRGYNVETASSPLWCGGVVQNICRSPDGCADVLIIDHLMPEMTGMEYLKKRSEWGCRATNQRMALMSGFLSDSLKQQALKLGCTVFEKPVRLNEIEAWLTEVV